MLQKTHVISFFCGICLENHQIGSVPWCDKWKISSAFFMFFPTKFIYTAQYHDATHDVPHLNVFTVFCIKSGKAARYHDATNDARHLKFSCFFFPCDHQNTSVPWQMTRVISCFRGIFNESHQNGSVPRCYKWQISSAFFIVFPMEINQNGSVPRCYN